MPVDELKVKSGFYQGQQAAQINIEIIKHLRKNNPMPPDTILHEALTSEKRILKHALD